MADDVKYTTRPDGKPLSRARALTRPEVLVVVPATAAREASPAALQALAVASELPAGRVRDLAGRDLPIVAARAHDVAQARALARRLEERHGLRPHVLAPTSGIGPAAGAFVVGVLLALGALLSGYGLLAAGLLVAAVAAAWGVRAAVVGRDLDHAAAHEADVAARDTASGPAWQRLHEVRVRTLADDVPADVQVDLWRALDDAERDLAARPGDAAETVAELGEVIAALDAAPSAQTSGADGVARLRRAAAALRATRAELGR
jgi:hypothetical protein